VYFVAIVAKLQQSSIAIRHVPPRCSAPQRIGIRSTRVPRVTPAASVCCHRSREGLAGADGLRFSATFA
jgi:hypothetical protein